MAVTSTGAHQLPAVGDRARHERHLERRHERLTLAVGGVGQLDVIDEPTRRVAAAVRHLGDGGRQVEREGFPEAEPSGVVDEVCAAGLEAGQGVPDVAGDLGRADEVQRPIARERVMAVPDPEPADQQAILLGRGLLLVGGRAA